MARKIIGAFLLAVFFFSAVRTAFADGPVTLGRGSLTSIALSPDGTRLAVGTTIGVYFYDAQTFAPQGFWATETSVNSLQWSPRGDVIQLNRQYRSANDGTVLWTMDNACYGCVIGFRPDGSQVMRLQADQPAELFDPLTGALLGRDYLSHSSLYDPAQSPDGFWQVMPQYEGTGVDVYAGQPSQLELRLRGHAEGDDRVEYEWAPNSRTLYTAASGSVIAWEIPTGKQIRTLSGFTADIKQVVWSPDGQRLIAAQGHHLGAWDVNSRQPIQSAWLDEFSVYSVSEMQISPAGNYVAVASGCGITMHDGATLKALYRVWSCGSALAFSPNSTLFAVSNGDFINIREAATGRPVKDLLGAPRRGFVAALAFDPDGQRLYSLASDGQFMTWNWSTGESISVQTSPIYYDPAIHPTAKRVATERGARGIDVSDTTTGALKYNLPANWPRSIIINPQGTRLAAIDYGTAKVWDLESGVLLFEYTSNSPYRWWSISDIAFSPDGARLAVSSANGTVKIYNIP